MELEVFEVWLIIHIFFSTFTMRPNPASLPLIGAALAYALPAKNYDNSTASCRFALDWPQEKVLENTDKFIWDLLYWEGKFHQNDVSYNSANGMSYDGTQLDWVTGEPTKLHTFSAASKEVRPFSEPSSKGYNSRSRHAPGLANHALQPRHRRLAGSRPLPDARQP